MKKISLRLILCLLVTCMIAFTGCKTSAITSDKASAMQQKPSPDQAIQILKDGNERFVSGTSQHPRQNKERLIQAGKEDQGDHAYATIITCSDSRVPVELIFDAGVMDIFVIRVAGNVCDTDERLHTVHTPVMVLLGHTQCGAVTAGYGITGPSCPGRQWTWPCHGKKYSSPG